MKKLIALTLLIGGLVAGSIAYSATGDKPNQMVMQFRNVSSTIKPTCVAGEMKYNATYHFVCAKTNVWKRYSGATF